MVRTPSQTLPAPTNPNCGRMEFCQGPREDRCWALPSFLMRVAYRSSPHLNLLLNVNSCLPRRKPRRKQAGMRELCRPNLEVGKAAGTCLHLHACRSVATISALLTQPTHRSAALSLDPTCAQRSFRYRQSMLPLSPFWLVRGKPPGVNTRPCTAIATT